MAYRKNHNGHRGSHRRNGWAREDRAIKTIARREGREACEAGRDEANANDGRPGRPRRNNFKKYENTP